VKHRRLMLGIVGIAGDHMRELAIEQDFRKFQCLPPERARKAVGGHLYLRAGLHPLGDLVCALAEQAIAFGMRDDRYHSAIEKSREYIESIAENEQVAELDKQVI